MTDLRMPSLGADMDRGTILEWKVAPGDAIHKGDVVAVIDTEKSDIEIETFHDGVVAELLLPVGAEVEVGTPIATLVAAGEPVAGEPAGAEPAAVDAPTPVEARPEPEPATTPPTGTADGREAAPTPDARHHVVRSPIVRRLAEAAHVDIDAVAGTGPGGTVTRHDVELAAELRTAAATGDQQRTAGGRPPSSPLARRLAAERGLDLTTVTGSGPGGAVVAVDLDRAAGRPSDGADIALPAPAPAHRRDRTAETRRATGELMARAKREIPHYYLSTTIDMRAAMDWLARTNAELPVTERILSAALLLKATAVAVREVPRLNGWWIDGELQPADAVDVGVGVSLRGGGLVAPAIPAADGRTVTQVMTALREVVARARSGRLRASDLIDPSITVTNLGDQGVESVFGVIYPPQVAVVGFGAVLERPWAVDGMLTVRPLVTASLAADHRATDGHEGARFLSILDRRLQEPETL